MDTAAQSMVDALYIEATPVRGAQCGDLFWDLRMRGITITATISEGTRRRVHKHGAEFTLRRSRKAASTVTGK